MRIPQLREPYTDFPVGFACFPKSRLAGVVFGGGVGAVGEIAGNPALEKAYEMGKAVC